MDQISRPAGVLLAPRRGRSVAAVPRFTCAVAQPVVLLCLQKRDTNAAAQERSCVDCRTMLEQS